MEAASVRVVCRFRPPVVKGGDSAAAVGAATETKAGKLQKQAPKAAVDDGFILRFGDEHRTIDIQAVQTSKLLPFTFDHVFDRTATQEDVFSAIAFSTVKDVMQGYNGTIFAYGQTGAGKSHTLFGPKGGAPKDRGVIPRAVKMLFDEINEGTDVDEVTIKLSFLEIYKENIRDLLDPKRRDLRIRETPSGEVFVQNLAEEYCGSDQEIMEMIAAGEKNRTVAGTDMNEVSSRSHAVITVTVTQKLKDGSVRVGKLNMADLAGSERIQKTNATGETLEEAKKINQSLSALGNCISALTEKNRSHTPFRDSTLTFLLKDSLGGNTKTTLLVCCSSEAVHSPETVATLRFAQRAKSIKNLVSKNAVLSVAQLTAMVEALRKELAASKKQNAALLKQLGLLQSGRGLDPELMKIIAQTQAADSKETAPAAASEAAAPKLPAESKGSAVEPAGSSLASEPAKEQHAAALASPAAAAIAAAAAPSPAKPDSLAVAAPAASASPQPALAAAVRRSPAASPLAGPAAVPPGLPRMTSLGLNSGGGDEKDRDDDEDDPRELVRRSALRKFEADVADALEAAEKAREETRQSKKAAEEEQNRLRQAMRQLKIDNAQLLVQKNLLEATTRGPATAPAASTAIASAPAATKLETKDLPVAVAASGYGSGSSDSAQLAAGSGPATPLTAAADSYAPSGASAVPAEPAVAAVSQSSGSAAAAPADSNSGASAGSGTTAGSSSSSAIAVAQPGPGVPPAAAASRVDDSKAVTELRAKNAFLEQTIVEMKQTWEAYIDLVVASQRQMREAEEQARKTQDKTSKVKIVKPVRGLMARFGTLSSPAKPKDKDKDGKGAGAGDDASQTVIRKGWLFKKPATLAAFRQWSRRWFVLRPGIVEYWEESAVDKNLVPTGPPRGSMELTPASKVRAEASSDTKHAFDVVSGDTTYKLHAASAEEMKEFMAAFAQACKATWDLQSDSANQMLKSKLLASPGGL